MDAINLEIVTPSESLVQTKCDKIIIPGFKGELDILQNHRELLSTLVTGLVKYQQDGTEHKVAVKGGFLQVNENNIRLLADEACTQSDHNAKEVSDRLKELEALLISKDVGIDERELLFVERDWPQALIQL